MGLINISDEGRMDCLLDLERSEEGRPERPDISRLSFSKDKYGKYDVKSFQVYSAQKLNYIDFCSKYLVYLRSFIILSFYINFNKSS